MPLARNYPDYASAFADEIRASAAKASILDRAYRNENGCLIFTGSICAKGYARSYFAGTVWQAHRLLWLLTYGDIGELVVDHKCRQRNCVNLAHLEPVTYQENVRRGKICAHGGKCRKGHDYTLDGHGWAQCRICHRENMRAKRREKKAERAA